MIKIFLDSYKKLKPREKFLVAAFVLIVSIGLYSKFIYKPLSDGTKEYKLKIQSLKSRLNELQVRLPELTAKKKKLKSLEDERKQTAKQIESLRGQLPAKENISELLGEFSRQAEGVRLLSLRRKIEPDEAYPRLFIEVKFDAPYEKMIDYVRKLETISPFLKIEEVEYTSSKIAGAEVSGKMIFSSLLSKTPSGHKFETKEAKEPLPELRNIFTSSQREIIEKKTEDLTLEGITFIPQSPSAIINGEVVSIDSQIDGLTVKKIFPRSVVLSDGKQEYTLVIQR